MTSDSRIVSAAIGLRLIAATKDTAISATFEYNASDPYAVRVTFHTGHERKENVVWLFARELLSLGLSSSSGDGDVRVSPNDRNKARVYLELASPSGHALFEAPRGELLAFLSDSYDLVAQGQEDKFCDLDEELDLLLHAR